MTDYTVTVTYDPPPAPDIAEVIEQSWLNLFSGTVITHHEGTTRVSVPFSADDAVGGVNQALLIVEELWVDYGVRAVGSRGASFTVEELTD